MLICNTNPIKCNFVKSYDDLVGKPSINGVTLEGNISFGDLGLSEWLEEETKNFLTTSELDTKLAGYIKNENNGSNAEGFIIESIDGNFTYNIHISYSDISMVYNSGFEYKSLSVTANGISVTDMNNGGFSFLGSNNLTMNDPYGNYVSLDAATIQAIINRL